MIDKNKKGFTLIETIIYLAIVGILLTATVNLHLVLSNTSNKLNSNILASRNRRVALSAIDYLVDNSNGLLKSTQAHCSDFSSQPPVLALYFEDDTYLPGTCVGSSGGGVRITVEDKKLILKCYPNMTSNGYYDNCDTSSYPAVNAYYLSSDDVQILDSSLSFSTSTATSTANQNTLLSTVLSVGTPFNDQVMLRATSTATSTVVIKNDIDYGLVGWYKFDDVSGSSAVDSSGRGNDLTCTGTPTPSSGLIDGSSGSFDFNQAESDYCYGSNQDDFNFNNAFTISAWIKMDYTSDYQSSIWNKVNWASSKGYLLMNYYTGGRIIMRIGDSTVHTNVLDQSSLISDATVYNVTSVYDLDNDEATLYVYQKGVGEVNNTNVSGVPTLVNYEDSSTMPRTGTSFDGQIDELRIYNRALSDEEVEAIQSQGAS